MKERNLDTCNFKNEKKYQDNFHLLDHLPVKCDYHAPEKQKSLKETNQANQGARCYENEMIEEEKNPNQIKD